MQKPSSVRRRMQRGAAALMLVVFLPVGAIGCFGKFQLLRNVYTFNNEVTPDPWMRWFVFLVMSIVPIYGLAGTIDLFLANSIEFWSGSNPIQPTPGTQRRAMGPDGSAVTLTALPGGVVEVALAAPDGRAARFRVVQEEKSLAARDTQGVLLARVGDVGGRAAIVEVGALADAHEVIRISP